MREVTPAEETVKPRVHLTHCTLTGVDDRTALPDLARLTREFPLVEWGVLYSPKRAGQPGRYPALNTILRALDELPPEVRVAVHFCGQGVPDLLDGEAVATDIRERLASRGGRAQLNFASARLGVAIEGLRALMQAQPRVRFITQHNGANAQIWEKLAGVPNHAVLFDASGGQGKSPDAWPMPLPGVRCGYAGGLGPDNLAAELDRIATVADSRPTWIDMEGKLRHIDASGADWLNLDACRACLEAARDHALPLSPTMERAV